eukprot:COSAG04_NODE_3570_length_2700_cov_2.381007_5_plen_54_part_00
MEERTWSDLLQYLLTGRYGVAAPDGRNTPSQNLPHKLSSLLHAHESNESMSMA